MKLTAKGEYAVRAMARLALHYQEGPLPLPEIARKEKISLQFLEQIFLILRRAGLIESMRGAHGGYILGKPPDKIPIGDIVRAVEGPIAPVDCLLENDSDDEQTCNQLDCCLTRGVWEKLRDRMQEVLDDITLLDIIRANKKNKKEEF